MSGEIRSYRDLQVWQRGMDLAAEAYRLAKILPRAEEYRLTSQLVRAAASVPANIAEGNARGTRKDYAQFVSIARGSVAETETLILLAVRVGMLSEADTGPALQMVGELGRQLNVLRQRLSSPKATPQSPIPSP